VISNHFPARGVLPSRASAGIDDRSCEPRGKLAGQAADRS